MSVSIADMKREDRTRYPLFLATAATLLMALFVAKAGPETVGESKLVKRFDPVVREIEGWKVHIDPKMLGQGVDDAGKQPATHYDHDS